MNYLILSIIVVGISTFYERFKKLERLSKGVKRAFYLVICFCLCLFAGLRTRYNDTWAYVEIFKNTTSDFSSLFSSEFSIADVYLFQIWNYVIYNFVTIDVNVYFFICSIVFVCPAIYLIEKYSKNFTISIIIFMFGGMYLFSLAGLKQSMATGIILIGLSDLFKKKYFKYYIWCVLALGFHTYSILFLLLPILGQELFNKRTIIFCIVIVGVGILLSFFSGIIKILIDFLGKEVSEEAIKTGSVNIFRAVVFIVPVVLAILGRKRLVGISVPEKILIKIGLLSSIFMVLALFGNPILFGRIPQYFLIGAVTSIPLLISKAFTKAEKNKVIIVAMLCYILYGLYALYVDGAFTRDIFQLIMF